MSDSLNLIAGILGSEAEAKRVLEKLRDAGWVLELRLLGENGIAENGEIKITPAMIQAGLFAYMSDGDYTWEDRVEKIDKRMEQARRREFVTGSETNS